MVKEVKKIDLTHTLSHMNFIKLDQEKADVWVIADRRENKEAD